MTHTHTHKHIGKTPLDEGSARRRALCLHNTQHKKNRHLSPSGIRTISTASARPQTHYYLRSLTFNKHASLKSDMRLSGVKWEVLQMAMGCLLNVSWHHKTEVHGEKFVLKPHFAQQIPHGLLREWARVCGMRRRRRIARATAQLKTLINRH